MLRHYLVNSAGEPVRSRQGHDSLDEAHVAMSEFINHNLGDGGLAVVHVITMLDEDWARYGDNLKLPREV